MLGALVVVFAPVSSISPADLEARGVSRLSGVSARVVSVTALSDLRWIWRRLCVGVLLSRGVLRAARRLFLSHVGLFGGSLLFQGVLGFKSAPPLSFARSSSSLFFSTQVGSSPSVLGLVTCSPPLLVSCHRKLCLPVTVRGEVAPSQCRLSFRLVLGVRRNLLSSLQSVLFLCHVTAKAGESFVCKGCQLLLAPLSIVGDWSSCDCFLVVYHY
ncbi:hypothetical protein YC2023_081644 [Brassica napus]